MTDYTHADCYDADEVAELRGEVETRDRVIARLLDGWVPTTILSAPMWVNPIADPRYEPMSDGEAAIIRNHQEQTRWGS